MTETIIVEGMTCKHCEKSVHDTLTNINGVKAVKIRLEKGHVEVTYDESLVNRMMLEKAIEDQGYDVVGIFV